MIVIKGTVSKSTSIEEIDAELRILNPYSELITIFVNNTETQVKKNEITRQISFRQGEALFQLPDGELFQTKDLELVDKVFPRYDGKLTDTTKSSIVKTFISVVIAFLVITFTWTIIIPSGIEVATYVTPKSVRTKLDQNVTQMIDKLFLDKSKIAERQKEHVKEKFHTLLSALDPETRESHDFKLLFRSANIGPNAFALPGGTIVVLDEMFDDKIGIDAIIGVLSHEIAHVVYSHGLKHMYRELGAGFFLNMMFGGTGNISSYTAYASNIYNLKYSRENESQADRFGVKLLKKANFNADGMIKFFQYIADLEEKSESLNGTNWLSTHPSTKDRIQEIKRIAEASSK